MFNLDRAPITIWRFEDAAISYKELSENGGDEDWIARVPIHLFEEGRLPSFIFNNSFDSMNEPQVFDDPIFKGYKIIIGSHA